MMNLPAACSRKKLPLRTNRLFIKRFTTRMQNLQAGIVYGQKKRKKNAEIILCLDKAVRLVSKQIEFVKWEMQLEKCGQCAGFPKLEGKIKWTGSIVEWVELIYALYSVKRINNGEIYLKDLFQTMGEVFGFEVKEFANYFMNIKNRTDRHRTKFMDLLKDAVLGRMEDADRKPSRK
jgi:hypothetical protein